MSFPNSKDLLSSSIMNNPSVEMHNSFIPPDSNNSGFMMIPQSTRLSEKIDTMQNNTMQNNTMQNIDEIAEAIDNRIKQDLATNQNSVANQNLETNFKPINQTNINSNLDSNIDSNLTNDVDEKIKEISHTKLLRIQALYEEYKEITSSQEYIELENDIKRLEEKLKKKRAKKRKLDAEAKKLFKMISERMQRHGIGEIDLSYSKQIIKHENPQNPKATFGKLNLKKAMTSYFNDEIKAVQLMTVLENLIINEKMKNLKPVLVIKDNEDIDG
jgi:hypothetical protein